MLFQYLCGFKPVFYSTHSDDEPVKYGDLNDFRVSKGVPFDTLITWNILLYFFVWCNKILCFKADF